jgi:hypothetical protein
MLSSPFEEYEVEAGLRPVRQGHKYDLDQTLSSIVALMASVPPDAATANTLGTERVGNGVVINDDGLVLTIGYLTIEASEGRCQTKSTWPSFPALAPRIPGSRVYLV